MEQKEQKIYEERGRVDFIQDFSTLGGSSRFVYITVLDCCNPLSTIYVYNIIPDQSANVKKYILYRMQLSLRASCQKY